MKSLKRVLSFLVAMAMVAGVVPASAFTVFAVEEDAYPQILLDQVMYLTMDTDGGVGIFRFVPEENGIYRFYSFDNDIDTYGYIRDAEMNELSRDDDNGDENNFAVDYQMTAGEVYYLHARPYNQEESQGIYSVAVTKLVQATTMEIYWDDLVGYLGAEAWLDVKFGPENSAKEAVTWTSADPTVVTAWNDGRVEFVGIGTTIVTAASENGLTDTISITVREIPTIVLGEEKALDAADYSGEVVFQFIPEEDGAYRFYSFDNTGSTWPYIMDEYWSTITYGSTYEDGSFRAEAEMTAGKVYYLRAHYHQEESIAFRVSVIKLVDATSLQIQEGDIVGYADTNQQMHVVFSPDNGMEESITWTSADPKIATVDETGWLSLVSEGTTTITVTSEKGLTDTITVTVKGPEDIALGQTVELTTDVCGGVGIFRFVPEEDGVYGFYSYENSIDTYGYILDQDMLELSHDDDSGGSGNFRVTGKMTAGQTYYFKSKPYSFSLVGDYKVSVEKLIEATSVQIRYSALNGYVGEWLSMSPSFAPEGCISESVTWTSSDPNVATVTEYGAVHLLAPGSAVITVTSENSLTNSVTVTAKAVGEIALDQPILLNTSVDNGVGVFRFVPEVDGIYRFYSYNNDFDTYGYLLDADMSQLTSDDDSGESTNFLINYTLTAGQTYYWKARPLSQSATGRYTVVLMQLVDATGLEIDSGDISGYVQERRPLNAQFAPANAIEETITWTSSDPEVAMVDEEGYLCMRKVGKATITATSANGLEDSITVTVMDYPVLQLNVPAQTEITKERPSLWYTFTPEKDGYYAFYSVSKIDTYGALRDSDGNFLAENDDMSNDLDFKIKCRLEAGKTYILHTRSYGSDAGPVELHVEETKYVTDLQLISQPAKLEYVEDFLDNLSLKGLHLRATWSDGTTSDFVYPRDDMYIAYMDDEQIKLDTSELYEANKVILTCGEKSVSYTIQIVESPVDHLELVTGTTETYVEGFDTFDGGIYYSHEHLDAVVRIVYKDGTSKLAHVGEKIDGYYVGWQHHQHEEPWVVGTDNKSEIFYLDKSVNLPITVKENTVASVEVIHSGLTLVENSYGYQQNDYFYYYYEIPQDAKIKITYTDGTSKTVTPQNPVDGYYVTWDANQYETPWEVGKENYITVSYLGVEGKLPVQVIPSVVERIELNSAPTREYIYGDSKYGNYYGGSYDFWPTDLTGLSFTVYYTNGTNRTYTSKDAVENQYGEILFDGYPLEFLYELWNVEPGEHLVPVRYMGESFSYDVTLKESNVASLEVTKLPAKMTYGAWYWPDYVGMEVLITYTDGTTKTVKLTEQNSSYEYNMMYGSAVYTVDVDGCQMRIIDTEMSYLGAYAQIPAMQEADTRWTVSVEPLNITPNGDGTVIKVTYNDGVTETLTLTDVVYSEFDAGIINGLGRTSNGMLRYMIRTWYDDNGKPVRYIIQTMGIDVYMDAPEYLVGDMNEDGQITDADAMYLLRHTLFASRYPLNQSGDVNKDGQVTDADAMYLLRHTLFPSRYPL